MTHSTLVRRVVAAAVVAVSLALPLVVAAPAVADVPEGWSDPESVSMLHVLLVMVGVPLALFVLILLAVYVPAAARGERLKPGAPSVENQWLGGPRKSAGELAAPDNEESRAGGASARW